MRLNRGTIIFVAVLLIVIVAALAISNFQANAPGEPTPTPGVETGAVLPIEAAGAITSVQVIDNETGDFTTLTRADAENWTIDASYEQADRLPQNSIIETTAGNLVALEYTSVIPDSDDLAAFGLDTPSRTLVVTTGDTVYTVYVGDRAPTSPRYYVVVQEGAPEFGPSAEATAEATDDITPEATVDDAIVLPDDEAEATAEATEDPFAVTPFPTPVRLNVSQVTLEPGADIYVVPQSTFDTLFGWLLTPPYAPPPTPSLEPLPTVEITPELTVEATEALELEETPEATPEATEES